MELGRRSKLAAKLVVSLGLLVWLVAEIGTSRVAGALAATDPVLVAGAFLLVGADNLLRSLNWRLLLGTAGPAPTFGEVLYSFLVGGFFGSFLPSSLGPDTARTVALASRTDAGGPRTASSVVMLNLLGLWSLAVAFLCGTGLLLAGGGLPERLAGVADVLLAGAAAGVLLLPALLATRAPLPDFEPSSTIGKRIAEFAEALAAFRSAGRTLWIAFGLALVNQALAVTVVFTVFRAGGVDIAPSWFLAIVPLVHVARLVPVTVAGFGAEQGVMVGLFGLAGVAASRALAMSVVVSGLILGVQAMAGLLYAGASARSLGRDLRAGSAADGAESDDADDGAVGSGAGARRGADGGSRGAGPGEES